MRHFSLVWITLLTCTRLMAQQNLSCIIDLKLSKDKLQSYCDSTFCFFDVQDTLLHFSVNKNFSTERVYKKTYGIYKKNKSQAFLNYLYPLEQSINSINIKHLPSGNYHLAVYALDSANNVVCMQKHIFQKLNSKDNEISVVNQIDSSKVNPTVNEILENNFTLKYPVADIRKFIGALTPIAGKGELQAIGNIVEDPDSNHVKQFFYNFWQNHSPINPEQGWKNYASRLNEVAKKYGNLSKKGFQTDRGRIYLKYGKPDYEIQSYQEDGTRPYEVWQYGSVLDNQYTNVLIIFVQGSNNVSDMRVLHCNQPIEVQNNYWRDVLFLPGHDPDKNYRIYEFFDKVK